MTHKDKRHFSENPSCRTAPGTFHPAFTIVELIIVIIVVAMLAAMTIFAFGSWRSRTATTEVTNAMSAIASAMKNELTFKNAYPTSIPSNYSGNSGVTVGDATNYCIEGVSKAVPGIKMFISSSNPKPQYGTCVGGAIAVDPNTLGSKVAWSAASTSCAVGNFTVYCWGRNDNGQAGIGTSASPVLKPTITVEPGLVDNTRLIASEINGLFGTCAYNGTNIYCWGANINGQIGNGTTGGIMYSPTAVNMSGVLAGKVITQMVYGYQHVCVLASGGIYCWGMNSKGQLGDGTTTTRSVPVATNMSGVLAGKTITSISAGQYTTCAVADNQVYCWGSNYYGALGTGTRSLDWAAQSLPVSATAINSVIAGKTITKLSMGGNGGCILASGEVYCWGTNTAGELGDGVTPTGTGNDAVKPTPTSIDRTGVLAGKTITDVSKGYMIGCVVADSKPYCWGSNVTNGSGGLGNNSTATSTVPVAVDTSGVLSGKVATKVIAGDGQVCAMASTELFCWGGQPGTLGNGTNLTSLVPIAVSQP